MTAYKLFRVRKDGSIGSLFINAAARLPLMEWMKSESHPTPGFALRPGWHALVKPEAPHLSKTGRAWFVVEVPEFERQVRPVSQGGEWLLAKRMKIVGRLG